MLRWLGFFKEPAGALNNGKLFPQTAVFMCFFFFFMNRNVVSEMRDSLESVTLQILQLCWHTSSCSVWILVMRMELPLLTFVFLLSVLISSLVSAPKVILHLG